MHSLPKDALDEYIGETREMCERVSVNLGRVEKKENDPETLNSIYRDMHSIKGSSFLFGFKNIGQLAHVMETALEPIRHQSSSPQSSLIDALYAGLDLISKMMKSIVASGEEGVANTAFLSEIVPRFADLSAASLGADLRVFNDRVGVAEDPNQMKNLYLVAPAEKISSIAPNLTTHLDAGYDPENRSRREVAGKRDANSKEDHYADASSIRIPVEILDNLMNLVGELVLVRNQFLQFGGNEVGTEFQKLCQRLNIVTAEMQNDVIRTRMQPVGTFLTKFHRVVRDMSRDLGKSVELKLEGMETELDKTLVEAVKDPLTHLLRNSVDHGIENPEERRKSRKSETGVIVIRSFHEGGQVIIEIADDGRGLSRDKIGARAVEKGLISRDQLIQMTDSDVEALIFAPGLSTADKVSNISGRGVGMDVVKTNIERIGGSIDLQSKFGFGTSIRLKIPLTLAIIPALVIRVAGSRFAIPQVKVVELVRLDRDNKGSPRIEMLQGRPVYLLRGTLLPLVDLRESLKLERVSPGSLVPQVVNNMVVLMGQDGMFGLIVDEIVDSSDIVVKPLRHLHKNLCAYSGATIMGDGTVVLILDMSGLVKTAGFNGRTLEAVHHQRDKMAIARTLKDSTEYLLVDLGVPGRYVIPLCLVHRLEEFDQKSVERAGEQRVVRYRGSLLHLISVAKHLDLEGMIQERHESVKRISVVVLSKSNRLFGLEVTGIVDVVRIDANIDCDLSDRPGIVGSVIFGRDVMVVLDAFRIVDDAVDSLNISGATSESSTRSKGLRAALSVLGNSEPDPRIVRGKMKILLADDTAFFRRHVRAFLERAGYQVVTVMNGEEALKALESSMANEFAMVVTDIEMPLIDGFELVKRIRASPHRAELPVIALTTKVREVDLDLGVRAGFTAYLEKFNGDVLVKKMDSIFGMRASGHTTLKNEVVK